MEVGECMTIDCGLTRRWVVQSACSDHGGVLHGMDSVLHRSG